MHCTVPVPKDDCNLLLLSSTKYRMYLAGESIKARDAEKTLLGQILVFPF